MCMRKIVLFAVLISMVISPVVRAEGTLTDEQLDMVRTNCVDAQINLQRVQDADKRTRINRGHWYESTLRLMTSLNSRIAQNRLDAPDMVTVVSEYQRVWDDFRGEYIQYDDALTNLIKTDCKQEPTTFNDRLVAVRAMRQKLNDLVNKFDTLFDRYQTGLDALKTKVGGSQ